MLTGLPWDSFEIIPMEFLLLSSGEVALPPCSFVDRELAVPGLATVTLWRQSRQEEDLFLEERGGVLWEQQAAIFYSVLTNQVSFYPVPSAAL